MSFYVLYFLFIVLTFYKHLSFLSKYLYPILYFIFIIVVRNVVNKIISSLMHIFLVNLALKHYESVVEYACI